MDWTQHILCHQCVRLAVDLLASVLRMSGDNQERITLELHPTNPNHSFDSNRLVTKATLDISNSTKTQFLRKPSRISVLDLVFQGILLKSTLRIDML